MHALTVVAAFLGGGAAVTFIGAKLIERVHPPCGRFLKIGGLRQHVVELGDGAGVVNGPAIVPAAISRTCVWRSVSASPPVTALFC
jgi:hypothetical protein